MRVRLYNHSRFSDSTLRPLLERAAKAIGCKGPVIVKVTRGGIRARSRAESCSYVYRWALAKRCCRRDGRLRTGNVQTCGGWIILRPQIGKHHGDPSQQTERIYMTMLHEFAHVKDFQDRRYFGQYNRHWKNRPHERRAEEMAHRARIQKLTPGDATRLAAQLSRLTKEIVAQLQ